MGNSKNFATQILGKSTSSRSLTDPVPEEVLEEAPQDDFPPAQIMIDTLYNILMQRLDHIEHLVTQSECACPKK